MWLHYMYYIIYQNFMKDTVFYCLSPPEDFWLAWAKSQLHRKTSHGSVEDAGRISAASPLKLMTL